MAQESDPTPKNNGLPIHPLPLWPAMTPVGEKVVGHAADRLLDAQAKAVLPGLQTGMFVLSLGPSHYRQHAARDQL